MRRIAGGICTICGERIFSSHAQLTDAGASRCGLCRRIEPPFARAVAYGSYEGGLRELIHLLKYASVRPAAKVLGRMLAEAIEELEPEFQSEALTVVPVPLHRGRIRQREFNQAETIARVAIKLMAVPERFICARMRSSGGATRCRKPALPATSGARMFAVHSQRRIPKW